MVKIYTKTGDNGETSLLGKRVNKDCQEIVTLGDIDELNASIGVLVTLLDSRSRGNDTNNLVDVQLKCVNIQHNLFVIGSNVASLGVGIGTIPKLKENDIAELEQWIDEMEYDLDPLHDFILPGGCDSASQAFLARAVCRRAERSLVILGKEYPEMNNLLQQYLNRLSDVLFVLGRWLNRKNQVDDVIWKK